jgi:hypothetical protein
MTETGDTYYIIGGNSQEENSQVSQDNAVSDDTSDDNRDTANNDLEESTNSKNSDSEQSNQKGNSQSNKNTNSKNNSNSNSSNSSSSNSKNSSEDTTNKNSQTSKETTATRETNNGQSTDNTTNTCSISINCSTILDNMSSLNEAKKDFVPEDGWILKETTVTIQEGDTVFDILQRICKKKNIHMEYEYSIGYSSSYIEGINQLYEFDCGELSGWVYCVNGWFPNYGCGEYEVEPGDKIEFLYTCDMGTDLK